MQFSQEKRLEKENEFIQPIIVPIDGLFYKIVYLIHQLYKKFFHLSQNFNQGTEKKQIYKKNE